MAARLVALFSLLSALLVGALKVGLFLLRHRALVRRASAEAQRALAAYRPEACPSLPTLEAGVFEVPRALLAQAPALTRLPGVTPTVIYFTGTGETPTAPLAAYARLVGGVPELAHAEHLVVEAPWARGAYYGSSAFSARVWDRVAPIVSSRRGPFVLVGLSRGALLALDVGERIAEEQTKVASVLALSPPLAVPAVLPASVVAIAGLEGVVARVSAVIEVAPRWAARFAERVIEQVHVTLTALVQLELGMLDGTELVHAVHDVKREGALPSSGRAVLEFRLLVEAHTRELELFATAVAATAVRTRRYFAALLWGEDDPWAPAAECRARMERALAREGTAGGDVVLCMLPGRGHGLFREHGRPMEPIRDALVRVVHEALARDEASRERAHRAMAFERTLRESMRPGERPDE